MGFRSVCLVFLVLLAVSNAQFFFPDNEGSDQQPTDLRPITRQLGCAAALICVEEQFCDMTGMISKTALSLTPEQKIRQVPMVDCRNPDNGVEGKCCRDPDYKDPWPAGDFPANFKGEFDERGFPKNWNLTDKDFGIKTRPRPALQQQNLIPAATQIPQQPPKRPQAPLNVAAFPNRPVTAPPASVTPVFVGNFPQPTPQPLAPQQPIFVQGPTSQPPKFTTNQELIPQQNVQFTVNVPEPDQNIEVLQPQQPKIPEFVESVQFGQPIRPIAPQQPPKTFDIPSISNFIGNRPSPQGEVVEAPVVQDTPVTQKPGIFNLPALPAFPSFPSFPSFGGKEIAPTSVQIQEHQPGSQCGIINQVTYNGKLNPFEVPFGEIPWMVMILDNVKAKPICSGALVAPNRVLTAAHCVAGLKVSEVSIKVGEWKLGYDLRHEEPYQTEIVQVESIVAHPAYHAESYSHDMVMLLLQKPVKLDQHVDTICVSESVPVVSQRKCISIGWGKYPLSIHAAGAIMKKIDVSPISREECYQRIQNAENAVEIDDSVVCVKAAEPSANMCMVDGGSPLACERDDGTYEIIGVYSQETSCQPTNQVATFAKIDAQWVNNPVAGPAVQVFQQQQPQIQKNDYVNYPGSLPSGSNQYLPPV